MEEIMKYKKPQATIIQGNVGIYPLTTADQVILADGTRLEKDGKINVDVANSADSAKLGGKAPEYYIQPRNLLDNSDFRKPVNQRGKTSYTGGGYTIDRWWMQTDTGTASIGDNGLTLATNDSTSCKTMQYVEKLDINKVYTFVIKDTSENVYLIHSVPNGRNEEKTSFGSMIVNTTNLNNEDKSAFSISLDPGTTITLAWAALYEGTYTADTLPPYVPKGYAAELAECQKYYYQSFPGSSAKGWDGMIVCEAIKKARATNVFFPQTMRIEKPTVTLYSPLTGNAGKASEFVSDTEVDVDAVYRSRYTFMLNSAASAFETGKHYCIHYTVSADL